MLANVPSMKKQAKGRKTLGCLKKGAKASGVDERHWKRDSKVCWGAVAASRVTFVQPQGLSKIFSYGSPASPPVTPFTALLRGGNTKQSSGHTLASSPLWLFEADAASAAAHMPLTTGAEAVTSAVVDSAVETSVTLAPDCPPEQCTLFPSPPSSPLPIFSSSSPSITTIPTTITTMTTPPSSSSPSPSSSISNNTLSSYTALSIPTTTSITTVLSTTTSPAPIFCNPSSSTSATTSSIPVLSHLSSTPSTTPLLLLPSLSVGSLASESIPSAVTPTLGAFAGTTHSNTSSSGHLEQHRQAE